MKEWSIRLGNLLVHNKEQWDLNNKRPLLCVHRYYDHGNGCKRVFCI
jgi:hypothetical protein